MPPLLDAPRYAGDERHIDVCEAPSRARWGHELADHGVRDHPQPCWYVSHHRLASQRSEPHRGREVDEIAELFEQLATEWEAQTVFESVVTRKAMHPAYQRIIGLGKPAVPLILERLTQRPGQWFWALTAITGEDPPAGEETVDGAVEAWLAWGRSRGLVGD